MDTTPTFNTFNNTMPDHLVLNILSQTEGSGFLYIMNSTQAMHNFIEYNMQNLIQQFIINRPYEQFLWETYEPTTIEQFKKNIHIQEFINSNQFEQIIENHNLKNIIDYSSGKQFILGNLGMNKERKLLFGMLLYSNYLTGINEGKLEMIIIEFDNFTDEEIKYFIKLIILNPNIINVEYCEKDIQHICQMNQQDEFLDYLYEMSALNASVYDILFSFISYDEDDMMLFKEYCEYGFWSEHAKQLINDDVLITENSKNIYFQLFNQVNYDCLRNCIEQNIIRNLTVEPLTLEEKAHLKFELEEYNYARGGVKNTTYS
jgi:hypothetical protein